MTYQTPDPFQAEGIEWLAGRRAALLADEPGLGKTLQAIRAADRVEALRVLVTCPASLCENWRREIDAQRQGIWLANVISYDTLAKKYRHALLKRHWDVQIFDEAHYLKNCAAKRTIAAFGATDTPDYKTNDKGLMPGSSEHLPGVVSKAGHIWLLTGTPMPNHAAELYPHLRAIAPDLMRSSHGFPLTYQQFVRKFCITRFGYGGEQIVGTKDHAELNAMLQRVMLRRLVRDVYPNMPPLFVAPLYVAPEAPDTEITGLSVDELQMFRDAVANDDMRLLSGLSSGPTIRRTTGMAKIGPARRYVKEFLQNNPGEKLVVAGWSPDVLEGVMADRWISPRSAIVTGRVPVSSRQKQIDKFRQSAGTRVIFLQTLAGGVGHTLVEANRMLCIELHWVPEDNAQMFKRIHRRGQDRPCRVDVMMFSHSIDESIQSANLRKAKDILAVVDGRSTAGEEFDYA